MNEDRIKGNWKQLRGKIREKWGKLRDDDLDETEGRTEQLVGLLQAKYGYAKDAAERELDRLIDSSRGA